MASNPQGCNTAVDFKPPGQLTTGRRRAPWRRFLLRAGLALLLVLGVGAYLAGRFHIG
jgi:hypothetical protein